VTSRAAQIGDGDRFQTLTAAGKTHMEVLLKP
jgi:hypothetical protein